MKTESVEIDSPDTSDDAAQADVEVNGDVSTEENMSSPIVEGEQGSNTECSVVEGNTEVTSASSDGADSSNSASNDDEKANQVEEVVTSSDDVNDIKVEEVTVSISSLALPVDKDSQDESSGMQFVEDGFSARLTSTSSPRDINSQGIEGTKESRRCSEDPFEARPVVIAPKEIPEDNASYFEDSFSSGCDSSSSTSRNVQSEGIAGTKEARTCVEDPFESRPVKPVVKEIPHNNASFAEDSFSAGQTFFQSASSKNVNSDNHEDPFEGAKMSSPPTEEVNDGTTSSFNEATSTPTGAPDSSPLSCILAWFGISK